MEYTNVVQLGQKLSYELKTFLEYNNLIGTKEATYLVESFESFLDTLSDPIVSEKLDNYKLQVQNPIEKYGASNEVINLIEEGKSPALIVQQLGAKGLGMISIEDVKSYIKEYEQADIVTKIEKSNTSVFDTEAQLEVIFKTLQSEIDNLAYVDEEMLAKARTTKYQLKLEYLREVRMTVKDATTLAQAIENLTRQRKFNTLVLKTVLEKCGATVYNSLVSELRKQELIFGM